MLRPTDAQRSELQYLNAEFRATQLEALAQAINANDTELSAICCDAPLRGHGPQVNPLAHTSGGMGRHRPASRTVKPDNEHLIAIGQVISLHIAAQCPH